MRPGVDGAVSHHHHSLGKAGFNRFGKVLVNFLAKCKSELHVNLKHTSKFNYCSWCTYESDLVCIPFDILYFGCNIYHLVSSLP